MPRRCTICDHAEREAIDAALVSGDAYRSIAKRFATSPEAMWRHKTDHVPSHLAKAEEARDISRADHLTAELRRIMARVNLLFDACDRWLRDPDNPERYDIGPRAEDVWVTYLEPNGEAQMLRRKARLSDILPKVERDGLTVTSVEVKHADPRDLLLKTSRRLEGQLELLAKLLGELQEGTTVNVFLLPEWQQLRARILSALAPHPQARLAVVQALERIPHVNGPVA